MRRVCAALLVFSGVLCADEVSDRKAIQAVIGSLHSREVRSDDARMAALTTADFSGDLDVLPLPSVWCETTCESFAVKSVELIDANTALVTGITSTGRMQLYGWRMVLKRDGELWRIASVRATGLLVGSPGIVDKAPDQ